MSNKSVKKKETRFNHKKDDNPKNINENSKPVSQERKELVVEVDADTLPTAGDYLKFKDNFKTKGKKRVQSNKIVSAFELLDIDGKDIVKLWEPFFQRVGIAALVGSSDTGKSTILRQLALSIVLKKDTFLGGKLNVIHSSVIYVSTEDDKLSTSISVKKQLKGLIDQNLSKGDCFDQKELLKNLRFIFEIEGNIIDTLKKALKKNNVDLIVLDSFADIFSGEINSNTQVRKFLNDFHKLAMKYSCLIVFLHHIGKRTEKYGPSKHSIIGTQAFEAKMRSVLDLRLGKIENNRFLTLVKCNFLPSTFKGIKHILSFNENLIFEKNDTTIKLNSPKLSIKLNSPKLSSSKKSSQSKENNPDIVDKVMELRATSLSYRDIEEKLKGTTYNVSKTVIGKIVKKIIPKKK